MSVFIDPDSGKQMALYSAFLHDNEGILRTALESFARHMSEAEKDARAAYEAGQADPEVKAQQDASMVTNFAYGHAADMFKGNAKNALEALTELRDVMQGA
jgi:hypothetical protein